MIDPLADIARQLGLIDPGQPGGQGTPEVPTTPDTPSTPWDSDQNPYKRQLDELRQRVEANKPTPEQVYHTRLQEIETHAASAYAQLIQAGYQPQLAQQLITLARQSLVAQAQIEAERAHLLPVAIQAKAAEIAKEYTVGNAVITPDELKSESTVEGMRARARALQEARRDASFRHRQQQGTDHPEPAAGGTGTLDPRRLESLPPAAIIKLGILQQNRQGRR